MSQTETPRTFTQEQQQAMYETLQSVDKILGDMWLGNLHTYERREICKAWENINATLQALAATEPAREPATGRYVVSKMRDGHGVQDTSYLPTVLLVKHYTSGDTQALAEYKAQLMNDADERWSKRQAAAALNADSTGTDKTEPTTWYTAEYNKRTGTFMVRETESVEPAGYDNAQSAQDECDRLNSQAE